MIKFIILHIDKVLHVFVCMLLMLYITALAHIFCNTTVSCIIGGVITLCVGIGKELYDKNHQDKHSAEWGDILADLVGIALGLIPIIIIAL